MDRKLASIRVVKDVQPIEGADNIVKVLIDGWQCVAQKGQFAPGELCVYFEIDSFLPIRPEFEFLRKSCYRKMREQEGFRLRTIKLRGTLSQGLVLPLEALGFGYNSDPQRIGPCIEGQDVTLVLGVTKWEPPIPAQLVGLVKGNFPSFIRKTDQERVQNIWDDIKHVPDTFEVTVKLDGTSCTYYLYNGEFGVCSRNMDLKESEGNTYWKVARQNKIEELLRAYGKNIALQGEIIGEGIQGNPEGIKGQDFYLFDIWDIDAQAYLRPPTRSELYKHNFSSLNHVTVVYFNFNLNDYTLDELLGCANGPSLNSKIEGIVFKSNDSNLTFKVISNEYLLGEK
jgi:RNA ligase (TIGR02306 family)